MNRYQTVFTDEDFKKLPKEVKAEFYDLLENVPFIKWLTQPEEVRGFAKYRPKDTSYNDGRILVDVTKPHILEDMDFFRERAIFHQKHGKYTDIPPNPNPKSEWAKFWKRETARWKHGYIRPSDGEWIPGSYYFYLNYTPIWQVREVVNTKTGRTRGERFHDFPKPWLGDYLFFHYQEQAIRQGAHSKIIKCRGVGFSFKMASLSPRNMYIYPGTGNPNFHLASDSGFLTGDKGIWGKILDNLDWIAVNTPLPRLRSVDRRRGILEVQLGYDDKYGVRRGLQTSVTGISLKDNADKARGLRGVLIHYEEDGLFPNLETAWNINRSAVEDGGVTFGLMCSGGCLTENNYVWNNKGELIKISELNIDEGIIGFNEYTQEYSKEAISYWQPPTKKECVRITTNTGRTLECSIDHPVLWSHQKLFKITELPPVNRKRRRRTSKITKFRKAENIQVGEQVATINEVPIFSDKEMWNPRFVGWMVGDGSYGYDSTPVLSNCDSYINNWVEKNMDSTVERTFLTKDNKVYEERRIRGICPELRKLGIYGQTRNKKRLPNNIHSYSKYSITEFIGGFYDADGTISKDGKIGLSSGHKEILLELMLLLQKLGIHGNIMFKKPRKSNPRDKNGYYTLEVGDRASILNFHKHIRFTVKHKQDGLEKAKEICEPRKNRNAENLPGVRFERVVKIENIGVQSVYNLTASSTNTYVGNGIVTHNTGGTVGADFAGSERLFYNPGAYNIYGVPNVYDKNSSGSTNVGFFWGSYLNRNGCYDLDTGEPDVTKALVEILIGRAKIRASAPDSAAITQNAAENALTPQEAVMRVDGTMFPVADLKEYLSEIAVNESGFTSSHYIGELVWDGKGGVTFVNKENAYPIRDFPALENKTGAFEIFELPVPQKIDYRYIIGVDTYDDDVVEYSTSLGSAFVFDRWTRRIVAEFTGRPASANAFYEIVHKMAVYYNATVMYESNKKGLFTYFNHKSALTWLANTPEIITDKQTLKPSATNNTSKGINATAAINSYGLRLQSDWMLEQMYDAAGTNEVEDSAYVPNYRSIKSIGYLKEAIAWHGKINADRVSAMNMVMIYDAELEQYAFKRENTSVKRRGDDPIFDRAYQDRNSYNVW